MTPTIICILLFIFIFGSALLGMFARIKLPDNHLNADSKDVIKWAIGLIATMTALLLGLVTASAKSTFDRQEDSVRQLSAKVVMIDRILATYGPETKNIRQNMHDIVSTRLALTWPSEDNTPAILETPELDKKVEQIEPEIESLQPQNEIQTQLKSRALQVLASFMEERWLMMGSINSAVQIPFIATVAIWLCLIFATIGLFAPANATVIFVLFVCSLSVDASIFLILEMDTPFAGIIKVSSSPLRFALTHIAQ